MNLIHTLFEPAGEGPHPTIIALHGWGSSALDLLGLAPYIAGGKFMLICPQGPLDVDIGAVTGHGWFPIRTGTQLREDQVEEAVDRVEKAIDETLARYPVDKKKLAIAGFSQGGVMAFRLAFRNPQRYAALLGLSTYFPPELKDKVSDPEALERLPTLIQHGRADDAIPLSRAKEAVEHLRQLEIPVTFKEYDCGHEITASSIEDLSEFLIKKVL